MQVAVVEARGRIGGRAWTQAVDGLPVDLGCGWLHSADRNPWSGIAQRLGLKIDKTPPPWTRPSLPIGFSIEDQRDFRTALDAFYDRVDEVARAGQDMPASECLPRDGRWNALIGTVATFVAGAEWDKVSAIDLHRYADTGVNWRAVEGYGHLVARHAAGLNIVLDCRVRRIDHGGRPVQVESDKGAMTADAVIVTIPSALIARETIAFTPALPDKIAAAMALPLGHDDKLFLSLAQPDEFEKDSRLFGRTDRTGTGAYHMRPFGRPLIECYYGGSLAEALEAGGPQAFFAFAREELVKLLGSDFATRIAPMALHSWGTDPFAGGAYSYARPGYADCRSVLATPVDGRMFFAGEACSPDDFSTAHGAYLTGIAAAERLLGGGRG
jgi:monoamine oxidase